MHFCVKLQFTWQHLNIYLAPPLYQWRKPLSFSADQALWRFSSILFPVDNFRNYENAWCQSWFISTLLFIRSKDICSRLIGPYHDLCTWNFYARLQSGRTEVYVFHWSWNWNSPWRKHGLQMLLLKTAKNKENKK